MLDLRRQSRASFELGNFLCLDLDGSASLRIAACTCCPLRHGKRTEAYQRNFIPFLEGFGNRFREGVEGCRSLLFGNFGIPGNLVNSLGFVHRYLFMD